MATVDETIAPTAPPTRLQSLFARFEDLLARLSEHLNPILVKEARQALKSRQFTITFILVLLAGWCWSILGIALIGPGVYWSADGPSMFYGYFLILAFPLIVIVPYGAYRSLASEREDRTYELLSITTLKPRQIIGGKLAGATLQMIVYLSAISPCLAFTYLLRGLDILTIGMIIVYLCLASLGLSMFCLLLATGTSEKYQQVVLSVAIVFGLAAALIFAYVIAISMLSFNAGFDDEEFWVVNAAFLSIYSSYFALFFLAAASQISFPGSNRSTPLRIVTLVQQALLLAWIGGIWTLDVPDLEELVAPLILLGIHWYAMGIFMTGEPRELSPRVKRDLPQSFLGRTFLTWFNPGPASGYVFALTNYCGACAFVIGTMIVVALTRGFGKPDQVLLTCSLGLSYLAIYLGIGRLLLGWLGRYVATTVAIRFIFHLVLLFLGTMIPLTIQLTIPFLRDNGYTLLQISNPFWTMNEAVENAPSYEVWGAAWILGFAGAVVFALNLPAIAEEVRQLRIAAPARVAEEDAEQAAAVAAAVGPIKTNPWD
jgi:hypothetical protein